MDLVGAIVRQFEDNSDCPYLIDSSTDKVYTYTEIYDLSSRIALELRARGVGRGDRVAICLANSVEFVLFYFGCLCIGAVAVPVNPALSTREINFILRHCGLRLLVHSMATQALVEGLDPFNSDIRLWKLASDRRSGEIGENRDETWSPSQAWNTVPGDRPSFTEVSGSDLFTIHFTSGTTSRPKGVFHRAGSLLGNALAFNRSIGFERGSRFLHVFPMAYMAGFLNTLLCPFMAGASVVLAQPTDARTILNFWQPVIDHQVDTLWLTPSILAALLRADRSSAGREYCHRNVKRVCVGTAPLSAKIKKDFEERYSVEVLESYGLSELLFVSTNSPETHQIRGTVGRILEGVEVRLIGEDGQSLGPGQEGEILVRTPYVMAGYLDYDRMNPDLLDSAGWFPTGDIGVVDRSGHLFVTARKKDLVIRAGVNISPRAVEEVLLEHSAVDQVAVIGIPDELYGEEVVAVLKFKPGYCLNDERQALESLCRERLSRTSVPRHYVELPDLPVGVTGKVQKNRLREQIQGILN